MISAFGVDHGDDITKAQTKRRERSGAAIAGAGAATAGVGLVAGGVPGAKVDGNAIFRVKPGEGTGARRVASEVRGKAPAARAVPGGILGFRGSIHDLGTKHFEAVSDRDKRRAAAKPETPQRAFYRAHNAAKIPAEKSIMRGMKIGRGVSHGALGAGIAATAYGVHRAKTPVKKRNQSDKYNGALVGAGAGSAAIAHGGSKYLTHQANKFEHSAGAKVDQAGKLVPALAGRAGKQMSMKQMDRFKRANPGKDLGPTGKDWPKTMHPLVRDGDIHRNPKLMAGVPHKTAEKVGALRGAAAQERHFSDVFRSTSKVVRGVRTPGLIVGGVGAGGLIASRKKGKS